MILRAGVRLTDLKPQTALAMGIVDGCYQAMGYELVVTSVDDSDHSPGSLHDKGLAFDCRTEPNPDGSWRPGAVKPIHKPALVKLMRDRLGENFQVVVEKDHLHVEASPILAPGTK